MGAAKKVRVSHFDFEKFSTKKWLVIFAIFAFLLYSNTIYNDYNLDDELVTIKHRLTSQGISGIPKIFTSPYYEDDMGYSYEYRPVTLVSFAIEHQFFGDNPLVSHFFNIVLYIFCSLMIFVVLILLFPDLGKIFPLAATFFFIVHPLHTEVVASIKNRDEILSLLGGLCAVYSLLKFINSKKYLWLITMIFFFLFGILSKLSVISFAIILPLIVLLSPNTNGRTYVIVSTCNLVVTGINFTLHEQSISDILKRITYLIIILFVLYVLLKFNYIIQLLTPVGKKIVLHIKNFYLQKTNKKILYEISTVEYIFFDSSFWYTAVTIVTGITGVWFNIHSLQFISFLILLFHPVFLHRFRLDLTVLSIFHLVFLKLNFLYDINFLLAFYHVWVFRNSEKRDVRILLLLHLSIAVTTILYEYLNGYREITAFVGDQLILLLIYSTGYTYAIGRGVILSKLLTFTLFLVLFISQIFYFQKDILLWIQVIFPLFTLLIFEIKKRKIIITIIMMTVISTFFWAQLFPDLIGHNFYPELYPVEQNDIFNTDTIKDKKNLTLTLKTDRPLNFVEFPLDIYEFSSEKVGTSFVILGRYLKMMLIPFPMRFYYGYNEVGVVSMLNPFAIFSLIIHVLLILSAVIFIKKHPIYFFGTFIYLSSIFVYSNLVTPVAGMMGDRMTFVASFGFAIIVSYVVSSIFIKQGNVNKKLVMILFSMLIIIFSSLTVIRNKQWKNHLTLFTHDIKYVNNSAQAHNLLAKRLVFESFNKKTQSKQNTLREEAAKHFEKAILIYPRFFNANYDLARTYKLLNQEDKAVVFFLKAAEIDSTFLATWFQAGIILINQNKLQQAKTCFEKVLSINSSDIMAYSSLSEIYFREKDFKKALEINLIALRINPEAYDPYVNTGRTYMALGDKKNSLINFEKAYAINQLDLNLIKAIADLCSELGEKEKFSFYSSQIKNVQQ